jgi:hypothetical protein
METEAITVGDRSFVALRKAGHSNASPVYHAVTPFCRIALCATEPGTRSAWAEPPASHVTCTACLNRLSRLQQRTPGGSLSASSPRLDATVPQST